MSTDVEKQIKEGMRQYLERSGQKVDWEEHSWGRSANVYGWWDHTAYYHIRDDKCRWIVPEGTVLKEETFSLFEGTDCDNRMEVGLNADGCRCACGKYADVTLRITASLGEAIRGVLGYDPRKQLVL